MKTALIISSFVASSHVGAATSAFCLRRLGVQAHVLPTTTLGRHPGWGPPGGGLVPVETMTSMWDGIAARDMTFDAVLTGYMSSPEHARKAAGIIKSVQQNNPDVYIMVDPVMGDNGRLYIGADTADAIIADLIPLANIITPNLWELGYLTQTAPNTLDEIIDVLAAVTADTLVTSVPVRDQIGALLHSGKETDLVRHEKFRTVPHGGGDALAATYLAHILNGARPEEALSKSTASIFDMLATAIHLDMAELPVILRQEALVHAAPLDIEKRPDERLCL